MSASGDTLPRPPVAAVAATTAALAASSANLLQRIPPPFHDAERSLEPRVITDSAWASVRRQNRCPEVSSRPSFYVLLDGDRDHGRAVQRLRALRGLRERRWHRGVSGGAARRGHRGLHRQWRGGPGDRRAYPPGRCYEPPRPERRGGDELLRRPPGRRRGRLPPPRRAPADDRGHPR